MRRLAHHPLAWSLVGGGLLAGWSIFVIAGGTGAIDEAIIMATYESLRPLPMWVHDWMRDLTALGGSGILLTVMLLTVAWLTIAARWKCVFMLGVAAMGLGMAAPELMKLVVRRARPTVHDPDIYLYTTSFPSGHAASSCAVYLTAALLVAASLTKAWQRRFIIIVALVLCLAIGLSRIALGVHWPSDVIGGWILGLTWAWTLWWIAQRWEATTPRSATAILAAVSATLLLTGCYQCPRDAGRTAKWAQPVTSVPMANVYDMGDGILRGPKPKPSDFTHLNTLGVRTILNLSRHHNDEVLAREHGIDYVRVTIDVWHVTDRELATALAVLGDPARRPVYMHCRLGTDRTGWVGAAYRVVYQGWTKDQALCEMGQQEWGFWLWRNLVRSIQRLDVKRMRGELGLGV